MQYVKLILSQHQVYSYEDASDIEMNILGNFLSCDAQLRIDSFKNIALRKECLYSSGNTTALVKEGDYIFISDLYSEEKIPTELKISCEQYIKLLDDWQ